MLHFVNEIIDSPARWVGYIILGVSAVCALIVLITASRGRAIDVDDVKLFRWTLFVGLAVFALDYLTGDYNSPSHALWHFRYRLGIVMIYGLVLTVLSAIMMAIARTRKRSIDCKPIKNCLRNGVTVTLVSLALKLLFGGQL